MAERFTVNLEKYNNSWYHPGAGKGMQLLWYFTNILFFINPLNPLSGLKVWLLRRFGAKIGEGVTVKPGVNIKYPWNLEIGDHCWIGERVWIDNLTTVTIGNNVCLSQGALLLTGNHDYKKETFELITGQIVLEEGVWIGAKSVVCPRVRIGSHAVLATGSVANKDLEGYTIFQGNPAQAIRKRIIEGA